MRTRLVLGAAMVLGLATAGVAQPVSGPSGREAREGALRLERSLPSEQRGAREQELYPTDVRSTYDPAFFAPATVTVRTGRRSGLRVGLSGWTSQALPFSTRQGDTPHATGDPALGVTVMWTVPLPEPTPEPRPAR